MSNFNHSANPVGCLELRANTFCLKLCRFAQQLSLFIVKVGFDF